MGAYTAFTSINHTAHTHTYLSSQLTLLTDILLVYVSNFFFETGCCAVYTDLELTLRAPAGLAQWTDLTLPPSLSLAKP